MRKKITVLLLQVSLVWMGLLVLIDSVGAAKKDAERALELLRQARAAIGGDAAIQSVQSISVKGSNRRVIKIQNQADKELNGEFEIALMMPDRILKMEKFGVPGGPAGVFEGEEGEVESVPLDAVKDIKVIRKGEIEEGGAFHHHENNELARFMLGFLLTAPKNVNVSYDYVGEETVDGHRANVIAVQNQSGPVMRLYLDAQSSLPLMISYKGFVPPLPPLPPVGKRIATSNADVVEDEDVIILEAPKEGEQAKLKNNMRFKVEGKAGEGAFGGNTKKFTVMLAEPVEADIQVHFSDYRSVNGVLLPFQMTQYANGTLDQTMTVEGYEINSPKTEEMFKKGHVRVMRRKEQ